MNQRSFQPFAVLESLSKFKMSFMFSSKVDFKLLKVLIMCIFYCRYKPNKWRFQSPNRRSKSPSECDHFTCTPGSSCKMVAASPVSLDRGDTYRSSSRSSSSSPSTRAAHLHCSPQLQKVVFRAVNNNNNNNISESSINNNNNNYWRPPDRSNLSLSIRPSFV